MTYIPNPYPYLIFSGDTDSLIYSPLIIVFLSILGVFLLIILILFLVTRCRKTASGGSSAGAGASSPSAQNSAGNIDDEIHQNKGAERTTSLMGDDFNIESTRHFRNSSEEMEEKMYVNLKKKTGILENGKLDRSGVQTGELLADIGSSRGKHFLIFYNQKINIVIE